MFSTYHIPHKKSKTFPVFFFISEKDIFARKDGFERRISEGQTGMFQLFSPSRPQKEVKIILILKNYHNALSTTFLKCISIYSTGIIAIAALLGVAIFVLLCVLLYCLCRGKKKTVQHHRVPVNTVPVSLEDRERLVYNSTTKPI